MFRFSDTHAEGRDDSHVKSPFLRVAVPSFRFGHEKAKANIDPAKVVSKAELQKLFVGEYRPGRARLAAIERAQLETAERIRQALYG